MHTIESVQRVGLFRDRLRVRTFKDSSAMHKFLNKGANGNIWREHDRGLKQGTYAFAGGTCTAATTARSTSDRFRTPTTLLPSQP